MGTTRVAEQQAAGTLPWIGTHNASNPQLSAWRPGQCSLKHMTLHKKREAFADFWCLDDGDIPCHPMLVLLHLQAVEIANAKIGAERNQQKTEVIVSDLDTAPLDWKSNAVRPLASVDTAAPWMGRRFAIDFRCRRVSCLTTRFYHFLVKGLSSVEGFLDFCVRGLSSLGHVGGSWAGRRLRLIVFGKRGKDPLQYFGTGRKSSPIVLRSVCCAIVACFCLFLLGIAGSCVLYFDGQLDGVTVRSGCDGKYGTKTRR